MLILVLTTLLSLPTVNAKKTIEKPAHNFPKPPSLKKDEYAIFIDDAYVVFKTKTKDELEFEQSCFKKDKLDCLAFEMSGVKPKNLEIEHQGFDNMAAIHCNAVSGQNLIALDYKNREFNFCRFKDSSMVNSWSLYFKHNPISVIK